LDVAVVLNDILQPPGDSADVSLSKRHEFQEDSSESGVDYTLRGKRGPSDIEARLMFRSGAPGRSFLRIRVPKGHESEKTQLCRLVTYELALAHGAIAAASDVEEDPKSSEDFARWCERDSGTMSWLNHPWIASFRLSETSAPDGWEISLGVSAAVD